jgi:hypothetical protein
MHEVESPLLKEGRAWFYGEDFVRQCSPLPTYQELLNHHLRNLEVDPTLLGWGDISAL